MNFRQLFINAISFGVFGFYTGTLVTSNAPCGLGVVIIGTICLIVVQVNSSID